MKKYIKKEEGKNRKIKKGNRGMLSTRGRVEAAHWTEISSWANGMSPKDRELASLWIHTKPTLVLGQIANFMTHGDQ